MKNSLLKYIYSSVTAGTTLLAYLISYFLTFEYKDLIDMFFGTYMISDGILFMANDAIVEALVKYPFDFLLSLIVFTALTFYAFISDSLALLDDTLLVKCDMINNAPILSNDDKLPEVDENIKFNFLDNIIYVFLLGVAFLESASFAMYIAKYEGLYKNLPFIIPVRFVRFICISYIFRDTNVSSLWYFVIAILNTIVIAVLGMLNTFMALSYCQSIYGTTSSLLLGCFIYFGATAIHNSFISLVHSRWYSVLIGIAGFSIPSIFHFFIEN